MGGGEEEGRSHQPGARKSWVFEEMEEVQCGQREVRGHSWGVVRDVAGAFRSSAGLRGKERPHVPFRIAGSAAPTSLEECLQRPAVLYNQSVCAWVCVCVHVRTCVYVRVGVREGGKEKGEEAS